MLTPQSGKSLWSWLLACALLTTGAAGGFAQDQYGGQQPGGRGWTVRADTVLRLRMNDYLTSKTAKVGDRFTASVTEPVMVNGAEVIPVGAVVEGRVTQVKKAGRMGKSGTIAVDFDELVLPDRTRVKVVGTLVSADPGSIDDEGRASGSKDKTSTILTGGALGAILGGIRGGGKGAAIGGIAGAGAGVAAVLLSKGEEAEVPAGTEFGLQLRQPITLYESYNAGPDPRDPRPGPYGRRDRRGGYADRDNAGRRSSDADRDRDQGVDPAEDDPANRDVGPRREPAGDGRRDNPNEPARDTRPPSSGEVARAEPEPAEADPPAKPTAAEPEPEPVNLPLDSPEMIRRAQTALRDNGYYEGKIDGVISPRVSQSLRTYQKENSLPQTGQLDPATAKSLGIMGGSPAAGRVATPTKTPASTPSGPSHVVLANIVSATAVRAPDGAIQVSIQTQANTGGWRWYGDHVVNGDVLEVFARAVRPTGPVTQGLTRGRIDLTVRDGVRYVTEVVIHGEGRRQRIPLGGAAANTSSTTSTGPRPSAPARGGASTAALASGIHRQAEELLAEYQRLLGVRLTGTRVEFEGNTQPKEDEIELLFALDSFANAAQLYARVVNGLQDRDRQRAAALSLAQQARRTDRVYTTISSRAADALATRWDAIRQDVLRLMRDFNISTAEIEN